MSKRDFYSDFPMTHPEFAKDLPTRKGDGDPKCEHCKGRGVVTLSDGSDAPPSVKRCRCVRLTDIARRMNYGWRGLAQIPHPLVEKSHLNGKDKSNLLVTSTVETMRKHVRDVALRKMLRDHRWHFDVITDAGLINAWLAQIKINNGEILDADVRMMQPKYADLESAVLPPNLLIVHLGVKAAANKETSNVLFEVISMRFAEGKTTWLFDQPHSPFRQGHMAWSHSINDHMRSIWGFEHVSCQSGEHISPASAPQQPNLQAPSPYGAPPPDLASGFADTSSSSADALLKELEEDEKSKRYGRKKKGR